MGFSLFSIPEALLSGPGRLRQRQDALQRVSQQAPRLLFGLLAGRDRCLRGATPPCLK
jgi:hypothetical protein